MAPIYINVQDHGATGDRVTDDTEAFKSAISKATVAGQMVGEYHRDYLLALADGMLRPEWVDALTLRERINLAFSVRSRLAREDALYDAGADEDPLAQTD
ncbi:glycosyl hydrolase family 28-related protein [Paenarthrobacter sp. R1]|uniref:glycosyl hydrolase family 28-related protein n=1 Tax=Paenarthrobacter sp. R1 TaxID=3049085 RepID=UPI002557522A|nr:glycosyl hydrolase family 28-related protein [Paenarthrobacter sp. R1]WIV32225.1 glycosyl hydrolase family 28-related protein [Paenarthrobacter sp. R1]